MSSFVPPPRRRVPLALALVIGAVGALPAAGPPPSASGVPFWQNEAWRQAANLLVDDALDKLPAAGSVRDPAERRALDFARGILLLNSQPKLQSNIDEARGLLESVRRTRADDDPGLSALYYLARIAEFHTDPRDPAKAATLYAELVARAPGHPLAQAALSRLAILRLYDEMPAPERQARLDEFTAAADRLSLPGARRDLHFVLADALLNFTDDLPGALRQLIAAEEAGVVRQQLEGDTLVRIALLARQLGQRDVAIAHYRKFLSLFQRDDRAYLLAEQLKELEASPPAASPPPSP